MGMNPSFIKEINIFEYMHGYNTFLHYVMILQS